MTPEERKRQLQRLAGMEETRPESAGEYRRHRETDPERSSFAGNAERRQDRTREFASGEERRRNKPAPAGIENRRNSGNSLRNGRTPRQSGTTGRAGRRNRHSAGSGAILAAILLVLLISAGAFLLIRGSGDSGNTKETAEIALKPEAVTETEPAEMPPETEAPATDAARQKAEELLEQAALLRAQYDYDGAAQLLTADPETAGLEEVTQFLSELETEKSTLVRQNISEITHVFFHILTVDPSNSFDSSRWGKQAEGYNSLMTTIPEFERILQEMYDNGYVLVSLHDMAHMETQADGTEHMVEGDIMLPEGKKAFVMSEDDVCYYEYMEGAGFADRMVIGEDGKPTLHYTDSDGNESVGDYDLVPILDRFIEEHPDFSYHGHKACLVFTGYNGVLGYRTDETYLPENYEAHKVEGGHDVEAERKEAVRVLKALYEDGYDLGSHSWGHRDMGEMSLEDLKTDMTKWEKNVNSLIREATGEGADILIYPKGADIGDWRGYTSSDQGKSGCQAKFSWLYGMGFRYFCNVDSAQYWVQKGDTYLRTGRRALDGYNFYVDITQNKGRFSDLWENTSEIFDDRRPTPVLSY